MTRIHMKKKINLSWMGFGMILITLVLLYWDNVKMVFSMDDLWYATNLVTGEPLKNIGDIVESQIWHYFNWGGRSVAHGLLQLTLLGGETFANICNIIAIGLVAYFICKLAEVKDAFMYLMALCLMVLLNRNWAQTMMWQAGVANYLYTTLFIFIYLWIYVRAVEKPEAKEYPFAWLFMIFLGILAGWSNENMGPAAFVSSFAMIIYSYQKNHKLKVWMIIGNLSCMIGSILVVVAPGNHVRVEEAVEAQSIKMQIFQRMYSMSNASLNYMRPALFLFVVLFIVHRYLLKLKLRAADYFILLTAVLSYGAMILSPHYPDRATFGTFVLAIIVMVRMTKDILDVREDLKVPVACAIILGWIATIFTLLCYIFERIGWIK